jgi:hypothetical protein
MNPSYIPTPALIASDQTQWIGVVAAAVRGMSFV